MRKIALLDRRSVLSALPVLCAAPAFAIAPSLRAIKVYKDASCGCCTAWVERLREAGFEPTVDERVDLTALKTRWAIPADLSSCHTASIGVYIIEGHVPPADIKRLIVEQPKAKGLAVAGMPVNSPGMEVEGAPDEPYTVWLFHAGGKRTAFAKHG